MLESPMSIALPGATSSQMLRKTLDWIAQEYERLESENVALKALPGTLDQVTANGSLRSTGAGGADFDPSPGSSVQQVFPPGVFDVHPAYPSGPPPSGPPPSGPPGMIEDSDSPVARDRARDVKAKLSEMRASANYNASDEEDERQARLDALMESQGKHKMGLFNDMEELKSSVKGHLVTKPVYDVQDFYHKSGIWQLIAKHTWFDNGTFAVIGANALWLAIDTDHNHEEVLLDAHPVFFVGEQFFCTYFVFELLVRFMAFEKKGNALKDVWFVFDAALAILMVLESWVLVIAMAATAGSAGGTSNMGSASVLKLAKMLRIIRMLRVARLLRSCPEFFILMKAISSAARATFFTCAFLFTILYVYGIAFTLSFRETDVGEELFPSVSVSMQTLFFQVTLGDGVTDVTAAVIEESVAGMIMLGSVILVTTITLMNTLIGVLCEAICAVAEKERMSIQVAIVEATLRAILEEGDTDHDGSISQEEFFKLIESRSAVLALEDIGIDVVGLAETADYFFEEHHAEGSDMSKRLVFDDFMQLLLELRGSNKATVKDIVGLKKHMHDMLRNMDRLRIDVKVIKSQAQNDRARASLMSQKPPMGTLM